MEAVTRLPSKHLLTFLLFLLNSLSSARPTNISSVNFEDLRCCRFAGDRSVLGSTKFQFQKMQTFEKLFFFQVIDS